MKFMNPGVPFYFDWIKENLKKEEIIGVDPILVPASAFKSRRKFFEKNGLKVDLLDENIIDKVWNTLDKKEPRVANKVMIQSYFTTFNLGDCASCLIYR